ncbi:MAG: YihY/virulence factor BrkB family protein [Oscillospiraceae bacterium]|nr:YihY/virulence factor BrkB family protein [Oscillospiraceae bacterium]
MPSTKQNKRSRLSSRPARIVMEMVQVFFRHYVLRTAAQMSYYLLFSLFPLLMIFVSLVGLLQLNVDHVMSVMHLLVDRFGNMDMLIDYVTYVIRNETPALLWAGVVMSVFASSAAFRGLMIVTGEIVGRPAFGPVMQFFVSLVMSVVLLFTIFALLLATVTGQWFLSFCVDVLHLTGVPMAWRWLRFPVMFALCILALTALYRVSLSKKATPGSRAWPGAVGASVALIIATGVFSAFISLSSRYSMIYGSLAGIVILLLWFFLCSNILVLGNVFNYALWHTSQARVEEPTISFTLPKHLLK